MKILQIVLSVLAVLAVVHGYNLARVQKYYKDLMDCETEYENKFRKDEISLETLTCALEKDGEVLDKNGQYVTENALRRLDDLISDRDRLYKAHDIILKCHYKVLKSGVTGNAKKRNMIQCTSPVIDLVDPLQ